MIKSTKFCHITIRIDFSLSDCNEFEESIHQPEEVINVELTRK